MLFIYMSKYPSVILFRHNNYSQVDSHIEENKENLMCTIHITNNIEDLNKLFNPNYHILVTYGNSYDEYHNCIASKLPQRFSGRWFHKTDISNIDEFNHNVNYCFVTNVINCREHTRPVFSIFTTCFKSYDYIKTAYESIKKQSLIDWEWVIMDDTPEDSHFDFLKSVLSADNRVRLYNRDKNSGNIGNVKNEVISLCRGKYILEMDHDDEILENCLTDAYNIFQTDEQIGFVYGDTIHLYRDGKNYKFNDFICKGYGGYYMEKINDNWVYVYNTPNINNITLSHLVCLPNHPRIWKRSVLMELESYSEFLPICDDYEILLRTCCSKYKVAKNNKAQYIQYANDDGNNFSSIRNSEINRIGPKYISPMFYKKYGVHDKMKDLDAYEEESYITNHSPIWKRGEKYQHKKMNQRINFNYDNQYCIINDAIDTPETMERVRELYKNGRNDFLMLSNRMTHEELQHKLESHGFDRMKCYSYTDCSEEELINYFKMMYKNDNCESEIIHSIKDNENNIDTNKIKHRVFIIHNNRKGGVDKYVSDIMNVYNNNEYIFIENKEMLYNQNYTEDDKLFIQNLLYCDIKIEDILSLYNTFHYKIIIAIHDFIWLCQEQHKYTYDIPSAYLDDNISVSNEVKQLLLSSDKVIMNSKFTYNVYSKYFDTTNIITCYPNDYKIQDGIKNVPKIYKNTINIGIFSYLDRYKGEKYVNYLRNNDYSKNINFYIIGENIQPHKETEFYDYIRKYNINGFLMLNEWGETYGYLLTKIINSGLPLLYNNFGAVKERIDSTQEHYFKVYDTECVNDIDPDYNVLDSQFNKFVEYINTNHGTVEDMNEDFTIVTRPVYDELFLYNNYTLHQSTSNDKNDNNTILIYTGFANTLWNYTYLQTNSIGGSEKAVACLGKELSSKYKVIISGDVMDELVDNVQYVNASKLQLLLNTQTFHTIIISRFLCFFEDYPFYSCKNLYICSHDSHGLINRLWNNSAEDINNINNILIKNNKNINGIVALTEWHKNKLIEIYPSIKDKTKIINNGIRLNDFTCDNKKIPNKFIWSSCSNRGLSVLLNMWSNIINVIPGATLDICSYHTFPSSTEDDKINEIILLNNSITHHGQLNTTELYELMSKSEFWLYTNTVDESSCITALEMLMNEVVCLYYPIAGLNDTLGNYGIPVNIGEEIQSILNLTTEKKEALKKQGKEYASSCSWKNRANEWTKMIDSYKEPWVFYHSSHFLGAMAEQYIDNLNSIYPEYFIYLTNNREELLINQPKKITFVYEIFDTEIIKSLPNTQFSFLNTEPLNIPVRLEHTINILKLYPNFEYYDYSQSNLKILEKNEINIQGKIYLPYKCSDNELKKLINFNKNTEKEFDFGILKAAGAVMTERREKILNFLKKHNFTVNIIGGWADDRDTELAKCKIILNIHGNLGTTISYIFEHIRCDRLLEAGFNILSEESVNLDQSFLNKYPNLQVIHYDEFFNIAKIIEYYNNKLSTLAHNNYVLNILQDTYKRINIPNKHITFLEKLSKEFYPENMIIYDIGSSVLHWTQNAKKIWINSDIYQFDGMTEMKLFYDEYNKQNNTNYEYNVGVLCDEDYKRISFYQNDELSGGNSYYKEIGHRDSATIFTENHIKHKIGMKLESVVKNKNIPMPDLIKIDVQGAELDILKGSMNVINHAKFLIVELQHTEYNEGAPLCNQTRDFLIENGWQVYAEKFCNNGPDADWCFINTRYNDINNQTQPKIIDCFIFYNELDLLIYRLNILNDVVDYFVLVESRHTFVGKEKSLFYNENKQLFEKFNHKIIHIIVDDFPHKYPNIDFEKKEQWNNEKFQRNCISRGIDKLELNNQDIIIIADVDEIPKIELLENIKYNKMNINEVKALQMDFYYYNLHSKLDHYTDVVRILPYDIYQNINMTIDDLRFKYYKNFITNAGWHLSYFGDENFIKNKIENFAHQELNIDLFTNQEKIHNRIKNTQDLFDRPTSIINIPIEDNDNLPPAYDIYLTNFYTDSIQNIRSTLVKYSNLRDNICKFENYDDYINWQIKTGRSFEKDNNKWMNGQRKCVEHNFDTMDRNSKILDICCGDGQGLKKFKEMGFKHVYGVEVCKDKINFAKQYGYTIYDCDICSGPFDIGDNYDCIYSSHTIEHVLNPEYTIRNIMTKLKNDGKFILILPYPDYAAGNTTNEHNFKVHCGVIPLGLHINDKGTTLINKIQQMGYKVVDYKFESYREPEIQLIITK
jgi:FkbM family methyltransferase